MSSPFSRETKRGTEETLEAISRTVQWASRIDTKNDVDVDVDEFVAELNEAEDELRDKYKVKTTEVAIDNFVFNQEEKVQDILCGNLDEKVAALNELDSYIADEFGYVSPLSFSKEELVWMVAQEVKYHQNTSFGVDAYSETPLDDMSLENEGEQPALYSEQSFPQYNRDS